MSPRQTSTSRTDRKQPARRRSPHALHGSSNAGFVASSAWLVVALAGVGCQSTATTPVAADVRASSAAVTASAEAAAAPTRALAPGDLAPLLTAEWALQRGEHDMALSIYDRIAPAMQDRGVAARATRIAQFLGRRNSALRHARLWAELDAATPASHAAYGNALLQDKQTLAAFDQAVSMLDHDGDPRFIALAEQARSDPALRRALLARFERALQRHPDSVPLALGKAATLLHPPGDPQAALALSRQALARQADNVDAMLLEITALERLHGQAAALEQSERRAAAHPQLLALQERFGQLLLEAEDHERAIELFSSVLHRDPSHIRARASLGLLYWNTDRKALGAEQFRILLRLGQAHGIAHYHLGLWAVQLERFEDALEHFRQVTDGHYLSAAAWGAAKLLVADDRPQEAREHLRALRQRAAAPAATAYLLEVDLLASMEQRSEADALLEEALVRHPLDADLLYARAVRHGERGDVSAAERDFRALLERDPENVEALNALGYMLTNHSQRYAEALALVDRALALAPDDAAVLDSKGWAHFRLGEHAQALSYLQRALSKAPHHEIAAHVGEALWTVGRRDEARDVWRQALADDPSSPILRETIERLGVDGLWPGSAAP